ncbi:MAG: type I glutamate--ammonia ligase [Clostridiales bacterium]|nr:type I glutamate--ammonia ligase [Clostridiales bacterium]
MFKTVEEAILYCDKENVKFIDFKLIDLSGKWHHLTITSNKLMSELFEKGIGFDGSSYGFLTVEKSDMVFKPVLESAFIDPFVEEKTLVMMTEIFYTDGERFESDPRYIAAKAENYIYSTGISNKILLGPEFEFYILNQIGIKSAPHDFGVKMDSENAQWNMGDDYGNLGYKVMNHKGYHVDLPYDINFNLRNKMVSLLEENDIEVKYHHPEVGGPGQMEIEIDFDSLLRVSDKTMKIKYLVKNEAIRNGKTVTFMPKPFYGEAGSGMHVHINMYKNDQPVFYDEKGYSNMSKEALYAIGGILKHAPSIMAFTNPSTNSFKRLVPGYEAPVSLCFGNSNRSAVIRIPGYANAPLDKRFEFRSSDATMNPYLGYSAIMLAAIDGIKNKIDPSENGFGPIDDNIFEMSEAERENIKALPHNLEEVVGALKSDYEFLLQGQSFSMNIIKDQIQSLLKQHYEVNSYPTYKEFEMYYDL